MSNSHNTFHVNESQPHSATSQQQSNQQQQSATTSAGSHIDNSDKGGDAGNPYNPQNAGKKDLPPAYDELDDIMYNYYTTSYTTTAPQASNQPPDTILHPQIELQNMQQYANRSHTYPDYPEYPEYPEYLDYPVHSTSIVHVYVEPTPEATPIESTPNIPTKLNTSTPAETRYIQAPITPGRSAMDHNADLPGPGVNKEHLRTQYGSHAIFHPTSIYPSASTLYRNNANCSCYSGCDEEYHATMCRCQSLECKYMNAIPNTLFETDPKWKYNTFDSAAACSRCLVWYWLWFIALFTTTLTTIGICLIICFTANSKGNSDRTENCLCCNTDLQDNGGTVDGEGYQKVIATMGCCDTGYCTWIMTQFSTACNICGCLSKSKTYQDNLHRGDTIYYSKLEGLSPPALTISQNPHFHTPAGGTQRNVLCCWRLCSCCCSAKSCPCCFTDWMDPDF